MLPEENKGAGLKFYQKQPTFVILGTKSDNIHYIISARVESLDCYYLQTRKTMEEIHSIA
jgi:hypothetical protein